MVKVFTNSLSQRRVPLVHSIFIRRVLQGVRLSPRRNHGFLSDESRDQRTRQRPGIEASRGKHRCHCLRYRAVDRILRIEVVVTPAVAADDGSRLQQPHDDDRRNDDPAGCVQEPFETHPHGG